MQTSKMRHQLVAMVTTLIAAVVLTACAGNNNRIGADATASDGARGEYLTTLLGCGQCHTNGALVGRPTGSWLAGSVTGIA